VSLLPQITLAFADGDYTFALLLPQLVELEEKCGYRDQDGNRHKRGVVGIYSDVIAGLAVVDDQVVALPTEGRASATDCREVIRLGLIGGGLKPHDALPLVERYVDARPIVERWTLAAAILRAAIEGYEPPKDAPAGAANASTRKPRSKRARSSPTAG
jgi:hypothetical protein